MEILNLTQHATSPEQEAEGVLDIPAVLRRELSQALTFYGIPTAETIRQRANLLAEIADDAANALEMSGPWVVMIGGAPYLMGPLEFALKGAGWKVLYSFSERVSKEVNGVKTSEFRHIGWVTA